VVVPKYKFGDKDVKLRKDIADSSQRVKVKVIFLHKGNKCCGIIYFVQLIVEFEIWDKSCFQQFR